MIKDKNSLALAHEFIESSVKAGDVCIDATAGRGRDTAFLCRLVGEAGMVYAFDIQKDAVDSTIAYLNEEGLFSRARIIHDRHENIDKYVKHGEASAAIFNFGYLPGGDHRIFTKPDSSITAINKALDIIKSGGIVSLCIYYGGDSGFEEKDALIEFLKTIDSKAYTVLIHEFINRPNCPPIVVDIQKH